MRTQPRSVRLALAAATASVLVLAIALVLVLTPSGRRSSSTPGAGTVATGPAAEFEGAPLPGATLVPSFTLTDQHEHAASPSEYRGRVMVISFLYTTCGAPCTLIAQQIRGALDELSAEHARAPAVLIVSADPTADTPARIARFLAEVSLTGRVEYLTGSLSQLRSIWHAYHVRPASAGRATFDEYASVLLVDASGRERVLFESEQLTPEALAHDIGKLDGDPTDP
jgi:protein SCO1/2